MNAAAHIQDETGNQDRKKLSEERAAELARAYGGLDGLDLLTPMIEKEFPGRIALSSSFGAEAAVLLDLVAQVDPATPVIFIDTGKLFEETYNYLALLSDHLGLTDVRSISPDLARLQESDPNGNLWESDPDACCHMRKVEPLESALAGFDAWITGRKQYHGDLRLNLEPVEAVDGFIKINPLVNWSHEKIQTVLSERKLPQHPLVARGYPSIGCYHCTREVAEGEDLRAGRWAGEEKTECGIHRASWATNQ
ncbi:MAG: phosphoadenylyl-sulfate reductase [Alphaproteobacteria bacterium]|nr:phosphoadenylyl-sulfate reductase [Alphaproteobacteria bacterium]